VTNYVSQEIPLMTGAVDLIVAGDQFVNPSLSHLANHYETPIVSVGALNAKRGLEKDPSDLEIRFQLGALYDKMGEFDKMVAEMKEVLRLNPNHADALNYLGYSYSERGLQLEEALRLIPFMSRSSFQA
jgi:tetratricopeptide (TPR) repeat protein